MTNFDNDDQPIAPLTPRRKPGSLTMDGALTVLGLTLAAASALFPWYVFLNPEKFRIIAQREDLSRELPDWPGRNVVSVSPAAIPNSDPAPKPSIPLDELTTATISGPAGRGEGPAAQNQPFPGKTGFRLLHVANGRALIEDSSGLYVVQVGSALPDNSRLAGIEQRNGKWAIITSKGVVLQK